MKSLEKNKEDNITSEDLSRYEVRKVKTDSLPESYLGGNNPRIRKYEFVFRVFGPKGYIGTQVYGNIVDADNEVTRKNDILDNPPAKFTYSWGDTGRPDSTKVYDNRYRNWRRRTR